MTPDGWGPVRLSEVADQRTEKALPMETDARAYVALEHLAQGSPTLLGWSRAGTATSAKTKFRAGDVLFGKLRPYLRKAAPAPFDGLCSTDILPLFGRDQLDTRYLAQLGQWRPLQRHAVATSSGTKMPRTSWAKLGEFQFSLPPLQEQRKIAAILASVDNAIKQTQAVIDQVGTVRQALVHELLSHGLSGRHGKKKGTVVGRIPDTWDIVRLGDVVSLPRGQKNPTKGPYRNWPLVAPNHVESGTGRLLRIETALEQNAKSGKYAVAPGDVVYSKIRPYLRKAVVATFRGLCSADMYPLRPKARVDSRFLLAVLLSGRFTDFANSLSTRTGIPKINREQLGSYVLAMPPAKEQKRMVRCFVSLDQRGETEVSKKEQLLRVKSALMSVLLTGELRVTPDPEPA